MRVPDIPEGPQWNTLSQFHKRVEVTEYPGRCEARRKEKIHRLRTEMQARIQKSAFCFTDVYAGTKIAPKGSFCPPAGENVLGQEEVPCGQSPTTVRATASQVHDGSYGFAQPDDKVDDSQGAWNCVSAPRFPIEINPEPQPHRDRVPLFENPFHAFVAEPVSRAQRRNIPKAQAACDKEWDKLLKRFTWDPASVTEWKSIAYESQKTGIKVHVAKIFEVCVVKGAELDDKDPRKIYKGRAVLDGSWVKDENYDVAIFNDQGSSPANMQAGKAVDQYGLLPDHTIEQADAEAAYTQCDLKGTATWVRLPEDRWPDSWFFIDKKGNRTPKFKDPVCRLHKALYGHPDAGTYWEMHAEEHLTKVGFKQVQDWRSCFYLH